MIAEVGDQRGEHLGVAAGEPALGDRPESGGQFTVDVVARPVALALELRHFLDGHPEQEEVLRSGLLAHFNVGAVEGADGQRPVHHEFHVAGAGGLLAGGRDLLGEVGGRVDQLAVLHIEVRDERHLHAAVDVRVGVDGCGDGVDQLDHQFGDVIAGCGLAAENERARGDLERGILLESVVEGDDVQHVEVLALVLVNALDLHVEHPVGIQCDSGVGRDVVRQPCLVLSLDGSPPLTERGVVGQWCQGAQLGQVDHPARADRLVEECAQTGIGQTHESARGHTVGLVAETFRPHLVEVLENRGLHQFGMHRRDPIDGVAADGGQISHADVLVAVLADDRHPTHPRLITGKLGPYLIEEATVDLVDDLQVSGQEPLEHRQGPGLERLG